MHFLRFLAVCWPGAQSAWDNHALACNFAKYSPIFKKITSSKPFLIWLWTTPSHLKYVATLPCNLSLMARFTDSNDRLRFYRIVVVSLWPTFWPTLYVTHLGIFQRWLVPIKPNSHRRPDREIMGNNTDFEFPTFYLTLPPKVIINQWHITELQL